MSSFYEQFAVVLTRVDDASCNGTCTYDANESGDVTDYEST